MSGIFKACYMHINRSACAHYMYFPFMHTDILERKFHDVIFCLSSFVHRFMFINVLFLLPFYIFLFYRSVQKSHTLPQVLMHCQGRGIPGTQTSLSVMISLQWILSVGGETYQVHRLTSLSTRGM